MRLNRADISRRNIPPNRPSVGIDGVETNGTLSYCPCETPGNKFMTARNANLFGFHELAGRGVFTPPSVVINKLVSLGFDPAALKRITLTYAGDVSGLVWGGTDSRLLTTDTLERTIGGYVVDNYLFHAVEHSVYGWIVWLEHASGKGNATHTDEIYWVWFAQSPNAPATRTNVNMLPFYGTNGSATGGAFVEMPPHCVACWKSENRQVTWPLVCSSQTFNLPTLIGWRHTGSVDTSATAFVGLSGETSGAPRFCAGGSIDAFVDHVLQSPRLGERFFNGFSDEFDMLPNPSGSFSITHYSDTALTTDPQTSSIEPILANPYRLTGRKAIFSCTVPATAYEKVPTPHFGLSWTLTFGAKWSSNSNDALGVWLVPHVDTPPAPGGLAMSAQNLAVDEDESNWNWPTYAMATDYFVGASANTQYYAHQSIQTEFFGL